eukprot:3090404-Amphidinium_carterae.1
MVARTAPYNFKSIVRDDVQMAFLKLNEALARSKLLQHCELCVLTKFSLLAWVHIDNDSWLPISLASSFCCTSLRDTTMVWQGAASRNLATASTFEASNGASTYALQALLDSMQLRQKCNSPHPKSSCNGYSIILVHFTTSN